MVLKTRRSMKHICLLMTLFAFFFVLSGCSDNATPTPTPVSPGQKLKVSFIDVGQADSILIQIPNGRNVLIDAGNNDDAGTITSYLKKENVRTLDIVIATHPHEDHIGSMDTVINTFAIGQFIMPRKDATTQTYRDMITALQSKGLKITQAKAGLKLDLGPEINASLLAPNSASYDEVNNYSAILQLVFGSTVFLFTGDAEEQSEKEMLASGVNLKADVLKVGHHGSNTSSSASFLAKVQPQYAVISVGKDNSYGHPAPSILDRLRKEETKVYRTDQTGTIIVESDGTTITLLSQTSSDSLPATSTASSTSPSSSSLTPTPSPSVIVYTTNTGQKYHMDNCSSLGQNKNALSLAEAKNKGYEPCKLCHPPE